MLKNIDIWYSSLTERVFMWKAKIAKWMKEWVKQFTWEKVDITNKFLHIVEQYFEVWTSRVIKQWEKETLYISVENTEANRKKFWI
jgi:hypothetical protein